VVSQFQYFHRIPFSSDPHENQDSSPHIVNTEQSETNEQSNQQPTNTSMTLLQHSEPKQKITIILEKPQKNFILNQTKWKETIKVGDWYVFIHFFFFVCSFVFVTLSMLFRSRFNILCLLLCL
jgi:hypothetical protein